MSSTFSALACFLIAGNFDKLVSVLVVLFLQPKVRRGQIIDDITLVDHLHDCLREKFRLKFSHFEVVREQSNFEHCVDVRSRLLIAEVPIEFIVNVLLNMMEG